MRRAVNLVTLLAASLLTGCASLSADGGFGVVEQAARQHLGRELQADRSDADRARIAARVGELLAEPLSMAAAEQIALLNHRGLQARFAELGAGDAERAQAGRLPNPGFSFGRLSQGDEREIERGLHVDIARLLLLPRVAQMEARRFEVLRQGVVQSMLALAFDTRRAWVEAVAAEETVRYRQRVMQAAEASAELARRMAQVGNFSALQRAREQRFYAEAALNLARAEQHQQRTREVLIRQLGLWGAQTAFTLPPRLPELPEAPAEQPEIERRAIAERLDVQAAKAAAAQTAQNLGLTRTTRFVNVLELGLMHNSSNEAPTQRGWELSLELPLFDWGEARVARAEGIYLQALHQAAQTAIDARSQVRQAYGQARSAYAIARHHHDELVPLAARIADENLLRYNGMLIGVFELLADARAQIAEVNAAIDALRDYWVAQIDLEQALLGPATLATLPDAAAAAAPAGDAGH